MENEQSFQGQHSREVKKGIASRREDYMRRLEVEEHMMNWN